MNRSLRVAFVSSFPADLSVGSGVVRMVSGFYHAFRQLGINADLIQPSFTPTSYLNLAVQRLRFNRQLSLHHYDVLIGSDFDGFTLSENRPPKIVLNGGILGDIIRFEHGKTRRILEHLAVRECQNVRSALRVVVPSQYSAQTLCRLYGIPEQDVSVIPLGIDQQYWQTRFSAAGHNPENPLTILCVAKQYPRKGIPDLIRALAIVRQAVPEVRLQLVGSGPQLEENWALVRKLGLFKKVEFVGDVTDDALLARYYRHAAVFCLPSYHETFGLVFLEAMAAGLPIVAYDSTAVPEVVSPEEGLLVPTGNVVRLAQNLVTLLHDAKLRQKLGMAGLRKVQKFTWQASAQKLWAIVEAVL